MDRIEIAVRIIERTVAMVINNGLNINIDALVNDAFNVADKVVERDKATAGTYPSWANWIAQDADGSWWCYEHEPTAKHGKWWPAGDSRHMSIRDCGEPNPNWRDTLRRVRR